ncbi:hypothetical protein ACKI1I_42500 [Streptomyces turgidiscabies]|uniref:hypothetical protein n=1 Tax=Streptomyces turgidiscabies TaxID=85558 RepID=UPI0038F79A6E
MADTLTFWMTVVATITGVVSMVVAVLDRRGPRRPGQGPSLPRRATGSCLYGTVMLVGASIVFTVPIVNIMGLWTGFGNRNPVACAVGLAWNVLAIPLDRWAGYVSDSTTDTTHKVLVIFCVPFAVIFAVLLVAG